MTALTWELVDRIATDLGAKEPTRQKWRQVGRQVPDAWRIRIVERAKDLGEEIAFGDFDQLVPSPGRIVAAAKNRSHSKGSAR